MEFKTRLQFCSEKKKKDNDSITNFAVILLGSPIDRTVMDGCKQKWAIVDFRTRYFERSQL